MKMTSETGYINRPIIEVFDYLSNLNNYIELLPKEKIANWKSDDDFCEFKIEGAANIGFYKKSVVEPTRINIISGGKSPIDFELFINLTDTGNGTTEGYIDFESNVNPFMRMMIEKPLKNLFNHMIGKMEEKFN